jgi:hypothetical protein
MSNEQFEQVVLPEPSSSSPPPGLFQRLAKPPTTTFTNTDGKQ